MQRMRNKLKLDYQTVVAYLKDTADKDTFSHITKIREQLPVYELLFDLIDTLKPNMVDNNHLPDAEKSILSFSEIDDLLIRILSGRIGPDETRTFIIGLKNSPVFYERLLIRLRSLETKIDGEETPELSHVPVKSDDEMFREIKNQVQGDGRALHPINTIWKRFIGLIRTPERLPRYAFAVPVIVIVTVLALYINNRSVDKENYVFDDRVPITFQPTVITRLRGITDQPEMREDFNTFYNRFIEGMLYYEDLDYLQTIKILEPLQPTAVELQNTLVDTSALAVIRDYYFYTGAAYLAISRTENRDVDVNIKTSNLENAKLFLTHSDRLTIRYNFSYADRGYYFMGLVFVFYGNIDSAKTVFGRIDRHSEFYEKGGRVLNQISL